MGLAEKIRLAVLFGGRSGEHEVSLQSARSILKYLDREKYAVKEIGITREGQWRAGEGVLEAFVKGTIQELSPVTVLPEPGQDGFFSIDRSPAGWKLDYLDGLDVVFPVLHGTFGEDGTIQGLLELADIAYVGAGVTASAVGMDKAIFKEVMRAQGIPVVDSVVITRIDLDRDPERVVDRSEAVGPYPLFTKPANLGSSVGITKCRGRSDLLEGLYEAARFDRRVIVERGVDAREIEVSVLGNEEPEASQPGEIVPAGDFYSYEAKYLDSGSQLFIPAPISPAMTEAVRKLALKAYRAIDGSGLARVDFLLDRQDGNLYLSEINTMPGFTDISMYPKLWEASGLPYPDLLDRLIKLALERRAQKNRNQYSYERDLQR
jgi:D-alanine-D-alanine ligase